MIVVTDLAQIFEWIGVIVVVVSIMLGVAYLGITYRVTKRGKGD